MTGLQRDACAGFSGCKQQNHSNGISDNADALDIMGSGIRSIPERVQIQVIEILPST